MGGKGGTGKTTFLAALAEWFYEEKIPVVLRDLDVENQSKGGLQHYYPEVKKTDVHVRGGLDVFFDTADLAECIVLADMGAGQGKVTSQWFAKELQQAQSFGIGFVFIGLVNNDPASVTSVLQWADALKHSVRYWIVLNEMQEDNPEFDYWLHTEEAQEFRRTFDPIVTKMSSRTTVLQGYLTNHGVSLGVVAEGRSESEEMRRSRYIGEARRLRQELFREFERVVPGLLPEV